MRLAVLAWTALIPAVISPVMPAAQSVGDEVTTSFATEMIALSEVTGGVLVRNCIDAGDTGRSLFCHGFVAGVADALQVEGLTCRPPSGVAVRQTTEVVRNFLRARPEEWARPGYTLARMALIEAFPCP